MACMELTNLTAPPAQNNVPQGYWRGLALSMVLWMAPAGILIIATGILG